METSPQDTPKIIPNPVIGALDQSADPAFANDPYVPKADDNQCTGEGTPPKTVEEILQSIRGYRKNDHEECGINESTNEHDDRQLVQPEDTTVESWESEPPPAAVFFPTRPPSKNKDSAKVANPWTSDDRPDLENEDRCPIEFSVREFQSQDEADQPESLPAPIRNAFEVDPEFYDFEIFDPNRDDVTTIHLDSGLTAPESPTNHVEAAQGEKANNQLPPSKSVSSQDAAPAAHTGQACDADWSTDSTESAECIFAADGDVIEVDGQNGIGHIDLACFDASDANVQDDQIKIACSDGTHFTVRYRNVAYAVFAEGVQIALSGDAATN